MTPRFPIDEILDQAPITPSAGRVLGASRRGRDVVGYCLGRGRRSVSLIGGCHADEPVGPAMLDRLAGWLAALDSEDPRDARDSLLTEYQWWIVPHVNPDGEANNTAWTASTVALPGGGRGYDLFSYLRQTVREPPGEDVEFGFPRDAADHEARPENRAVADFLALGAPFILHASFHGMAFAAGPWFLMEAAWIDRTAEMRQALRRRVGELGYVVHDIDRGGEKGFTRIDEGFTTRPDSRAMARHFEARGEDATARLFRPSSMEYVRGLGGDPLTLVSEMPLFLLDAAHFQGEGLVRPPALVSLRARSRERAELEAEARRIALRAMPIADQMRLQLAFLEEGLRAVHGAFPVS